MGGKRKPRVKEVGPRAIKVGDSIWSKDFKRSVPVDRISVVLHLANGHDEVYQTDARTTVGKVME